MEKYVADVLALRLAQDVLTCEPETIIGKHAVGIEAADNLADFIKQLSLRLQYDLDNAVEENAIDDLRYRLPAKK